MAMVLTLLESWVNAREGMRLHFIGVEELLDVIQANQRLR